MVFGPNPIGAGGTVVETLRQAKRIVKIVVGFTLLLIGIVLLVLPGPGWLTILLGLALLAAEFAWAKRLLDRLKNTASHVKRAAQGLADRRTH
jgi:uncharacterized protein (TIGR02611 family)